MIQNFLTEIETDAQQIIRATSNIFIIMEAVFSAIFVGALVLILVFVFRKRKSKNEPENKSEGPAPAESKQKYVCSYCGKEKQGTEDKCLSCGSSKFKINK